MVSLLLAVFVLQLTIHLINTYGKELVLAIAWHIYGLLPTRTAQDARRSSQLRGEIVRLKREMTATSAQDNFSKWAKLRREHDKVLAEYEKVSKDLAAFKSSFDNAVNTLRWAGLFGLRFLVQIRFQKVPMFWLPRGWLPFPAEWLLSFPRAPVGAVSIQVWGSACGAIIGQVSKALEAGKTKEAAKKGVPIGVKANGGTTTATQEKKEL